MTVKRITCAASYFAQIEGTTDELNKVKTWLNRLARSGELPKPTDIQFLNRMGERVWIAHYYEGQTSIYNTDVEPDPE